MDDTRAIAIAAVLVLAPFALIALALIVRGYTVSLHLKRPRGKGRNE